MVLYTEAGLDCSHGETGLDCLYRRTNRHGNKWTFIGDVLLATSEQRSSVSYTSKSIMLFPEKVVWTASPTTKLLVAGTGLSLNGNTESGLLEKESVEQPE